MVNKDSISIDSIDLAKTIEGHLSVKLFVEMDEQEEVSSIEASQIIKRVLELKESPEKISYKWDDEYHTYRVKDVYGLEGSEALISVLLASRGRRKPFVVQVLKLCN